MCTLFYGKPKKRGCRSGYFSQIGKCILKNYSFLKDFSKPRPNYNRGVRQMICPPGYGKEGLLGCYQRCKSGYSKNVVVPTTCLCTSLFLFPGIKQKNL